MCVFVKYIERFFKEGLPAYSFMLQKACVILFKSQQRLTVVCRLSTPLSLRLGKADHVRRGAAQAGLEMPLTLNPLRLGVCICKLRY